MSEQIKYNSEELEQTVSILNESEKSLEELKTTLGTGFEPLKTLSLFQDGLAKITSQVDMLIESNTEFSTKLVAHKEKIKAMEDQYGGYGRDNTGSYINSGSHDNGSGSQTQEENIDVEPIQEGTPIKDATLLEYVPKLTYDDQKIILKALSSYKDCSLEQLFFDVSSSAILTALLKQMFGDTSEEFSIIATSDSTKVQKIFLETIAKTEGKNLFTELTEKTILAGMPYFKNIAKNNNISVSDLMIEEKYSNIFVNAIKDICDGNTSNKLTEVEASMVRGKIEQVAKDNNLTVDELLDGTSHIDMIRKAGAL